MIPYYFAWVGFAILFLFICLILYKYRKREYRRTVSSTGYRPRGNHYIVNMSSSDNDVPRYHGQDYVPLNPTPTAANPSQLPTYRPNNDIVPPPPSYQDYKKDIRLPNTTSTLP
ncbi:unnamed protein product [Cunninghamella blakesleeana]